MDDVKYEIKRPGGEWQDDDRGAMPIGTLSRRKFVEPPPGVRKRCRRAILRVAGVSESDGDGNRALVYESTGEIETREYGV